MNSLEQAYLAARERGFLQEEEGVPERLSELELQARIYGGEFGDAWTGEDGEAIEIVHFGTWNREPGPDFRKARVRINGVEVDGDIEVDSEARDWENHGHQSNPAFGEVILHIFFRRKLRRFFTRTHENKAVPQVVLGASSKPITRQRAATPIIIEELDARRLIEAAARFRLGRKHQLFQRAVRLRGRDDALFQGIAMGLGYKNNKIPFLLVAQRSGLARSRTKEGEALLFGLAGFLQAHDFDRGDNEARTYLRQLWETWWSIRDREARLVLSAEVWKFAALRPANHPHRRMGALVEASRAFPRLSRAAGEGSVKAFTEALTALDHPYWRRHASLATDRLKSETGLIGGDRANDLVSNVLLPSLSLENGWDKLAALPGPAPSRKALQAAAWLCGPEAERRLARSAMAQQGLIQLHDDFFPQDPVAIWEGFAREGFGKSANWESKV
ncbi:hypothetical protein BH09VER1_BH09VER1_26820 [soil metagenome]